MIVDNVRLILAHPLNRGRPLFALKQLLFWQIRARFGGDIEVPWVEDLKLLVRRGMTGATGNIYNGLHEAADMAFMLHLLRAGDVFLDVGANIGSYTILASKVCGARSFAFEPDPGANQSLQRNIDLNGVADLVTVHRAAVSDANGSISFTVGHDTMNRVAAPDDTSVQTVPMVRLDDLDLAPPTLIKMDVEGHEEQAMNGALSLLAQPSLLAVISEGATPAILKLMSGLGFERRYYNPLTREVAIEPFAMSYGNALFLRKFDLARLKNAPRRKVHGLTI